MATKAEIAAAIKVLQSAQKKPLKKKAPARKSQATKKAPTKRLASRRAKPAVPGYFPNPIEIAAAHKAPVKKRAKVATVKSATHPYSVQVEREGKWFGVADFSKKEDAIAYAKAYAKRVTIPVRAVAK